MKRNFYFHFHFRFHFLAFAFSFFLSTNMILFLAVYLVEKKFYNFQDFVSNNLLYVLVLLKTRVLNIGEGYHPSQIY